jgi:hypothetical protein
MGSVISSSGVKPTMPAEYLSLILAQDPVFTDTSTHTRFPTLISSAPVQFPTTIRFAVAFEFQLHSKPPSTYIGLMDKADGADHTTHKGFNFVLTDKGCMRFNCSQERSFYNAVIAPTPFPMDGKWHQVVGVCTGTKMALYCDGVLCGVTTPVIGREYVNDILSNRPKYPLKFGRFSNNIQLNLGADGNWRERILGCGHIRAVRYYDRIPQEVPTLLELTKNVIRNDPMIALKHGPWPADLVEFVMS